MNCSSESTREARIVIVGTRGSASSILIVDFIILSLPERKIFAKGYNKKHYFVGIRNECLLDSSPNGLSTSLLIDRIGLVACLITSWTPHYIETPHWLELTRSFNIPSNYTILNKVFSDKPNLSFFISSSLALPVKTDRFVFNK